MMKSCLIFIVLLGVFINDAYAKHRLHSAVTKPIPISELNDYPTSPLYVQKLIQQALSLSKKKLTYRFGSANPKNKGMDCSGTIYYLLNAQKSSDVPRQSDEMFDWADQEGDLHKVSNRDFQSPDFKNLKPGDLLFWSGTYATHRESSISHVMIYLGLNKNNQPLMFGASGGGSYKGRKMKGVSVFDFTLPGKNSRAKFVGYSCIPHFTCS